MPGHNIFCYIQIKLPFDRCLGRRIDIHKNFGVTHFTRYLTLTKRHDFLEFVVSFVYEKLS